MGGKYSGKTQLRGGHKAQALIGLIIIALAVVGIIAVASFSVDVVGKLTNDEKKLREYDGFLEPIVIQDPLPFDSIETAEPEMLLKSAIWSALIKNKETDAYITDESGKMVVPIADIEQDAKRLFGPGIQLKYESFGTEDATFEYHDDDKSFHVPIFGVNSYSVYVESAKQKGDKITLKVGYVASYSDKWRQDKDGNTIPPEPSKYMEYELKQAGKSYYVTAVRPVADTSDGSIPDGGATDGEISDFAPEEDFLE